MTPLLVDTTDLQLLYAADVLTCLSRSKNAKSMWVCTPTEQQRRLGVLMGCPIRKRRIASFIFSSKNRRQTKCPCTTIDECGECIECQDKPKWGGLGIRKKKCVRRTCVCDSDMSSACSDPRCEYCWPSLATSAFV